MAVPRTPLVLSVVALAALIPVAGCAHTTANGATTGATSTPPASASTGTAGCVRPRLTITSADNNKTLCVTTGTVITVMLRGTPSDKWTPIHSSSIAVTPRVDPALTLQAGVTGAAFDAATPGTATISSTRPPGHFSVTLDIRP